MDELCSAVVVVMVLFAAKKWMKMYCLFTKSTSEEGGAASRYI